MIRLAVKQTESVPDVKLEDLMAYSWERWKKMELWLRCIWNGRAFHLRIFSGVKSSQHEDVYGCGILEEFCLGCVHTEPANFRRRHACRPSVLWVRAFHKDQLNSRKTFLVLHPRWENNKPASQLMFAKEWVRPLVTLLRWKTPVRAISVIILNTVQHHLVA